MSDFCDEIQKLGKGIGNATRYNILESLMNGPKTVGELTAIARTSQPAVSQHLKVLKACGLATDSKRGQEVFYALNTEHVLGLLTGFAKSMKKGRSNKNK